MADRFGTGVGTTAWLLLSFASVTSASVTALAPGPPSPGVILRKCCPEGTLLNREMSQCISRNGSDAGSTPERVTVSELRRHGDLWWLDATAAEPGAAPFLEGQDPGRIVELGAELPCEMSFAMVLSSRGRRRRPRLLRNGTLLAVGKSGEVDQTQASFPPAEFCADVADINGGVPVFLACACLRHACVRSCCPSGKVLSAKPAGRREDAGECVKDHDAAAAWRPRLLPRAGGGERAFETPLTFYRRLECETGRNPVLVRTVGVGDTGSIPGGGGSGGGDAEDGVVEDRSLGTRDVGRRDILASHGGLNRSRAKDSGDGGSGDGGGITFDGEDRFWLYDDGSVLLRHFGGGAPFEARHACAVPLLGGGTAVHACVPTARAETSLPPGRRFSYAAAFVVGAAFLLATLVAIALLPELRAGSYRAEVAHAACLLIGYVVLAASYLQPESQKAFCFAQAFLVQFSFLAAFFWLNVMCIDISWAFSGFRAMLGDIAWRDRRKFLFYSLYAWGCPTIICAVTALLEFTEGLPEGVVRPDIGVKTCWFYTKLATLLYFYGPMAVLLLMNMGLFAFTAWRIVQAQRDTEMLHRGESRRHHGNSSSALASDRERLTLYVKLFCLMGVTWITEFISWAEGSDTILWYVTDFINLLRGVFIFVIFCCKPKVLRLLWRRIHDGWVSLMGVCGMRCGSDGPGSDRGRATSIWWGSLSDPSNKSSSTNTTSASTFQTSVRMTEINADAARAKSKHASEQQKPLPTVCEQ